MEDETLSLEEVTARRSLVERALAYYYKCKRDGIVHPGEGTQDEIRIEIETRLEKLNRKFEALSY